MIWRIIIAILRVGPWGGFWAAMTALGVEVPDAVRDELPRLTEAFWSAGVGLVTCILTWYGAYKQGKKAATKDVILPSHAPLPWLGKK